MAEFLSRVLSSAMRLVDHQPVTAMVLAAALLAVFLVTVRAPLRRSGAPPHAILRLVYQQGARFVWAFSLMAMLAFAAVSLRSYLERVEANFRRTHGRVTQVNYDAVRTIWGVEQTQNDLQVELSYTEEVTERIESEDLTKPALIRKKNVRYGVTSNPFMRAHHSVTLVQNPRKKGSAVYRGYETDCHFTYVLRNPEPRDLQATLRFPLPSTSSIYNDLTVTIDGVDASKQLRIDNGSLLLQINLAKEQSIDYQVAFKSRGLSYWYMQMPNTREIRDFQLVLTLPDIAKSDVNYPGGCMTPTDLKATADGRGSVLTYRLDKALSNRGMGIATPALEQPGEQATAVLGAVDESLTLVLSALLLCLTLSGARLAPLNAMIISAAAALGYGLIADFVDSSFGFWGSVAAIFVPLYLVIGVAVIRFVPGRGGWLLMGAVALFGMVHPLLAGLDPERRGMYLDIAAVVFLALASWQVSRQTGRDTSTPAGDGAGTLAGALA